MKLLGQIEEKVNEWIWGFIYSLDALIPSPFRRTFRFFKRKLLHGLIWFKISPWLFLRKKNQALDWLKAVIAVSFKETLVVVENKIKNEQHLKNLYIKFCRFLTIIAHLIKRPFKGLSPQQGLVLVILSASSLMAGLSIFFQSQRIYIEETKYQRSPASIEEVLEFDRPVYYKKELRHVQINGVRIPVYYPRINELQTVTIDFNVTLSNRIGRVFIERREFPLRDHLIQNLEPTLAQYSLNEEGKIIIKEKIRQEVQDFLDLHQVDSEVQDLTLLYILAN